MKKFSIANLAGIVKAHLEASQYAIRDFSGVSTDSRTTRPGDCFFAIPGESFDGHDYVADAFAKGAVCAVVSKDIPVSKPTDKSFLQVEGTIKALGDFAGEYRRQSHFKVVAITGSAGKTTTRQIAYQALSQRFRVSQSPRSFNNNIGLPLTLLGAEADDQIVIAELGSNHPGEIAHLTRIAAPDVAVVINVHPAHLEGFGNLQTIMQEKLSISEGLKSDGILIINADFDRLVSACRAKGIKFITFGKSDGANYQARNVSYEASASRFTVDSTEVYLPLPGPGNVENALAAWAVCSQLGLAIDDFAKAVKTLSPASMRAELLQIGTLTVLNDCYNANPASMKNAMDILTGLDPAGKRRLVFICGDMAELGQQTERLHTELGTSIVQAKVGLLVAVGKYAKITAEAALACSNANAGAKTTTKNNLVSLETRSLQIKRFEDTISACNNLHEFIKDYDIVLVKGSRTAGLEMVVEKLKKLFS
ncbi:MAG TPA: UDP-N-acetylmuramoyl-tripeptide--D-alanyl-D-alanine ligase [Sedimentisphaerales bacterium]|nr:UDP-N-acetylmuramoyl-tripeptide--D-alanyl-D-alanine ligase [Sedimentisphaerales bacterium]